MKDFKKFLPHVLVILGFICVALAYFSPVLSGKAILQSDIVQYTGMAKEQIDFRENFNEEPYWTNSAFGGMPTYQLGAQYPHSYIKKLDQAIRFLPRPADYLFVYFLGFYILMISLRVRSLYAFFGALAFGFSTYLIIILGVGHNAKAHAIAYMPMVLAGVLLVFRKKYAIGGLLTLFAVALEINANHFQMTFYLLLLLLVVGCYYAVLYIKQKDFKGLGIAAAILVTCGIIAIGANATNLMATSEYTEFSTRSNSQLTLEPDGSPKVSSNAMSYDYITEYSYGIFESLNLFVPRLTGGANNESVGEQSNLYQFVTALGASPAEALSFSSNAPTYWGDQPIVAAPAYIGAVVLFLFVLACFVEKRNIKYVFLIGAVFSLLLSWGKNFPILTDLFIDYFPLYNKFRAVSSIQVILELCIPALAVLGLHSFMTIANEKRVQYLKYATLVTLGTLVLLFVGKSVLSFSGLNDGYYQSMYGEIGPKFIEALMADRKAMYTADILRSFVLIGLVVAILWFYLKEKLTTTVSMVLIGFLMVGDLIFIDLNYVNKEQFVAAAQVKNPFQPTEADKQILNDPTHFRVFEVQGALNSARASFFHNSLGGYHAAKPKRMQEIFDYQLAQNNMEIFNMMNVKYVIQKDEQQRDIPLQNDEANGNAWFVSKVLQVNNADDEMKALKGFKSKEQAVFNVTDFSSLSVKEAYKVDSLSHINLIEYKPNYLKYESENKADGLAVFSEVYYPHGWHVFIDGVEVPHFRVDYILRGLEIPKGKHSIEFKFIPEVVSKGSTLALISSILMLIAALGVVGYQFRTSRKE